MDYHYEQVNEPTEYLKIGKQGDNTIIKAKDKNNNILILPYEQMSKIWIGQLADGSWHTTVHYIKNNEDYTFKIYGNWQHVIDEFFNIH